MDLLDEIASDKSFAKSVLPSEKVNVSDRRILTLEIEMEAMILLLQAKGIFTEKEFELAGNHIIEEFATPKPTIDEAFMKARISIFTQKIRDLSILDSQTEKVI